MTREEQEAEIHEVVVEQFKPVLARTTKLEDLRLLRRTFAENLGLVDQAISMHPDTLSDVFGGLTEKYSQAVYDALQPLFSRVTAVSPIEGSTGGKNCIHWSGYAFKLEGHVPLYGYRHGSNWCSDLCEIYDGAKVKPVEGVHTLYQQYLKDDEDAEEDYEALFAELTARPLEVGVATIFALLEDF